MQICISELELDSTMVAYETISKLESKFIGNQMSEVQLEFEIWAKDLHTWTKIPQ